MERTNVTPELAAWESATMQNLGPMLSDVEHGEVWTALLENRESPNADALAEKLAGLAPHDVRIRSALAGAMTTMPAGAKE
jgi:hypothetical protein